MIDNKVGIFEEVREYPDAAAARRFASLVGLDVMKERLLKEARLRLGATSIIARKPKLLISSAIGPRSSFLLEMSEPGRRYWRKHLVTRSHGKLALA